MSVFVLPITTLYASINIMVYVGLGFLVVHHRIANQVAFGDGGIDALHRAIRSHANLAENLAPALILLAILELNALPAWQMHVLGGAFTLSRLSHIHGILSATLATRSIGALTSATLITTMAGLLLVLLLTGHPSP